MICDLCGKDAGFNRCGRFCTECIGGPLRDPLSTGPQPFTQAIGSRLNVTEAYRNDVRSRRIDRSHGVMTKEGTPFNKVYRSKPRASYVYGK